MNKTRNGIHVLRLFWLIAATPIVVYADGDSVSRPIVPQAVSVVWSCSSGQMAYESSNLGHSTFAYFLGKQLEVSVKDQPRIELADVLAHLRRDVSKYVIQQFATRQNPAGSVEGDALLRPISGHGWVWSVGINKYRSKGLPKLKFAGADAQFIAKTLVKNCGWKHSQIIPSPDSSRNENATDRVNLLKSLADFIQRPSSNDTLLVYWSGHSVLKRVEGGGDPLLYLCSADAELTNPQSMIRIDELMRIAKRSEARSVVFVFDVGRKERFDGSR